MMGGMSILHHGCPSVWAPCLLLFYYYYYYHYYFYYEFYSLKEEIGLLSDKYIESN